jgi:peptidylprolyl isomerase
LPKPRFWFVLLPFGPAKIFQLQINNMQQVKKGDTVKVHYHGKLTNGSTFDSSEGREPLEFEVGGGMVIPGFDDGVTGMAIGEKKTVTIPADQAYGPKQEEMVMEFPKDRFPEDMVPEVGMQLNMSNGSGQNFPVVIVEVKETSVILDANHPLAGETLIFDLELVAINGDAARIRRLPRDRIKEAIIQDTKLFTIGIQSPVVA